MDYLDRAGLTEPLARIGLRPGRLRLHHLHRQLGPAAARACPRRCTQGDLSVASVLSGNRNFEGRIHPDVRMNYLASPPLVVAYALAGTMDIDLTTDPLGTGADGRPVSLADLWPSAEEVTEAIRTSLTSDMFRQRYAAGVRRRRAVAGGRDRHRRHLQLGPRLDLRAAPHLPRGADHDAGPGHRRGRGPGSGQAGRQRDHRPHLAGRQHQPVHARPATTWPSTASNRADFNSYGARRGNHEVMVRGTFANVRLRNQLAPGTEGGFTLHLPDGEETTIYEAAERYAAEGVPLVVLAGKEYGSGSSRDWAAKGTALLGIRAVIAESYERIHRSNLIGMGVLPLQYADGQNAAIAGPDRTRGLHHHRARVPQRRAWPRRRSPSGPRTATGWWSSRRGCASTRPMEAEYYRHGGILPYMLRQMAG